MKHAHAIGFACAAALAMVSCTEPTIGIWASLEAEKPVTNNKTAAIEKSTPSTLVQFAGKYWVAYGGPLHTRDTTLVAASWKAASGLPADMTCSFVAATSSTIYAMMNAKTGPGTIYQWTDGSAWAPATGAPSGISVDGMWALNDTLYFAKRTGSNVYTIATLSGDYITGTTFPRDAVANGTADVVFITEKAWYLNGVAQTNPSQLDGSFQAVEYVAGDAFGAGGRYLFAISTGKILARETASDAWTTSAAILGNGTDPWNFSDLTYLENGGKGYLLAGTHSTYSSSTLKLKANGFVPLSSASGTVTDLAASTTDYVVCDTNNFATTLGSKPIDRMVKIGNVVFALVPGYGVWSSELSGSSVWTGFRQE